MSKHRTQFQHHRHLQRNQCHVRERGLRKLERGACRRRSAARFCSPNTVRAPEIRDAGRGADACASEDNDGAALPLLRGPALPLL
jgi:hypothetical protein